MPNRCDVTDAECEGQCNTECFRCGLPACKRCTSVVPYLRFGKKRICNNCMREGIEHAEPWACDKIEVPAPPQGAELSTAVREYWRHHADTAYQRALSKRGA
jgi:hypothetical protein